MVYYIYTGQKMFSGVVVVGHQDFETSFQLVGI